MKINIELKMVHLGDLIMGIQYWTHIAISNPDNDYYLCCQKFCRCCNVASDDMLKYLLHIIDTPVKYSECVKDAIQYNVYYKYDDSKCVHKWFRKPYVKAKNPISSGGDVVCNFYGKSNTKIPKTIPKNIVKMLIQISPVKLINIGDEPQEGCINRCNLTLREKFDLLSGAKLVLSIDSGIAHLALLTNAVVRVIHPDNRHPWIFYPENTSYFSVSSICADKKSVWRV